MEGFNLFKDKKSKQESTLGKISKIAKFATLGTGLVVGANNLEAQEIPQNKDGNIRPELEKNINIENEKTEEVNGGNIEEVTVYSKRKYVDELKNQQEKYLADMAKYKKDSAEWVNANELYKDSLDAYNYIKKLYDLDKELQDFSNSFTNSLEHKTIKKLYEQEEIARNKYGYDSPEYRAASKTSYKYFDENYKDKYDKYEIEYDRRSKPLDDATYRGVPQNDINEVDKSKIYHNIIDSWDNKPATSKEKLPIKLNPTEFKFYWGNSDGWNWLPYFKKPAEHTQPTKPETFYRIKYDPKYENLKMRSLWANQAKADPNAKIGTLNPLEYNDDSKGFTLDEAMNFPQEIKDQYNIDHIYNQIHGKEKQKQKENYKHSGWNYENPEK